MKNVKENKEREVIQEEAFKALEQNGFTGTVCLSTGTGKTKVAIDCILRGNFRSILITTPRTNLKDNWEAEIKKWGLDKKENTAITIVNIQTAYKWDADILRVFDLIIVDEIHFIGTEYVNYIRIAIQNSITVIGLTATPNYEDEFKQEVLYNLVPIVYQYYNSENDRIINKVNYFVLEYDLSDSYLVDVEIKGKTVKKGEKGLYNFYNSKMEEMSSAIKEMYWTGLLNRTYIVKKNNSFSLNKNDLSLLDTLMSKDLDYFYKLIQPMYENRSFSFPLYKALKYIRGYNYSSLGTTAGGYLSNSNVPEEAKSYIRTYLWAMNRRKTLLWSLDSSAKLAKETRDRILNANSGNKVLLFSELTEQADQLSKYSIHSNNGETAKKTKEYNQNLLNLFNLGEIRELSSCLSLTLGLNMSHANWAVFESYSGSKVNSKQKKGRLNRLPVDDVANVLIIKPKDTQAEVWFEKAFGWIEDYTLIKNVNELPL